MKKAARLKIKKLPAALFFGSVAIAAASLFSAPTNAKSVSSDTSVDKLQRGFETPPQSAKPRVWWHWLDGNITKDGIAKDLAWMHRVGIGGVNEIDGAFFTPTIVKDKLTYMS